MTRSGSARPALLGSLEEQVMLAVIRTGADAYGMNVRRELETVTGRDISIGSVYSTLDRLEAKGLVTSVRAAASDVESRRRFSVTPAGGRALASTRVVRNRLWVGVRLPGI